MASKNISANLKIGAALGSSVGSVFGKIKNKIKDQEATLKGLRAAYKQAEKGTGEYAGKLDELKAHISSAEKELKKLRSASKFDLGKSLKGIGSTFSSDFARLGKIAGVASAAIIGTGAAVYGITKGFVDWADDIGDTAEALDISTEALQTWQFAAGTVGVQAGKMNSTLGKFTASIEKSSEAQAKAAEKGKDYSDGFTTIGVNVARLKKLKLEDQLRITAEAFKNYQGPISQSALAIKLFGKSGYQLAGILKKGDEGLQRFMETGKRVGYILGDEAKAKVDQAASTYDTMGMSMIGLRNKIAQQFAPSFERIGKLFNDFLNNNGPQIEKWANDFAGTIEREVVPALVEFFKDLPGYIEKIKEWGTEISGNINAVKDFVGGWKMLGAILLTLNFAPTILAIGKLSVALYTLGSAWMVGMGPIGWIALAVAGIGLAIYSIVDPGGPLDILGKMFPETMQSIRETVYEIVNWISDKIDFLTHKISGFFSWIGENTFAGKYLSGFFKGSTGGGGDAKKYDLPQAKLNSPNLGAASTGPTASRLDLDRYISKPSNQTNHVTINVQTPTNNGAQFGRELNQHLKSSGGKSLFDEWNSGMKPAY